jgi:uncharacterized protein with PIN domain
MHVSFRLYGRLNDFLPVARRAGRFTQPLRNVSSVKDAIEALGVPHPEVDLILINSTAADFSAHVHDGDDVSAYPAFRSIDISSLRRAGADPSQPVRFAVDAHLGKLVSMLRLAGFDAVVMDDDADLANCAAREDRVALTRDVVLLKRSVIRHGYWVRNTDPEWQFAEVLERFGISDGMNPFSRCLRCNTPLEHVEAEEIADQLPPRTRTGFSEFRRCPGCGRIYWHGSHYAPLQRILERARHRLNGEPSS